MNAFDRVATLKTTSPPGSEPYWAAFHARNAKCPGLDDIKNRATKVAGVLGRHIQGSDAGRVIHDLLGIEYLIQQNYSAGRFAEAARLTKDSYPLIQKADGVLKPLDLKTLSDCGSSWTELEPVMEELLALKRVQSEQGRQLLAKGHTLVEGAMAQLLFNDKTLKMIKELIEKAKQVVEDTKKMEAQGREFASNRRGRTACIRMAHRLLPSLREAVKRGEAGPTQEQVQKIETQLGLAEKLVKDTDDLAMRFAYQEAGKALRGVALSNLDFYLSEYISDYAQRSNEQEKLDEHEKETAVVPRKNCEVAHATLLGRLGDRHNAVEAATPPISVH